MFLNRLQNTSPWGLFVPLEEKIARFIEEEEKITCQFLQATRLTDFSKRAALVRGNVSVWHN